MFYGIFGDTDGDTPQVIGEASWLLAQTCFPNDGLNGGKGHTPPDVTCMHSCIIFSTRRLMYFYYPDIVFTGSNAVLPNSAHNDNYITNFGTLKSKGDSLVQALANNLGL